MIGHLKNKTTQLTIGLLVVFSLFALITRLMPMFLMNPGTDILSMVASDDPLYNLRQVEQIIANYPNYAWYDPMTLFPTGSLVYWGSLFPTIIATVCIIFGATTRPEIIAVGLIIPPVMGTLMVTVMYFVGKIAGDWKTGIISAGLTAVVSGQFFYRSLYGYMDHHIAEVLFSSIFCLLYMYLLYSSKDADFKDKKTYFKILGLSVIAGFSYLVGMLVMPTMVLFAMIVGIFTLVQFVIDVFRGRDTVYLVLINTTIFIVTIIGLLTFGFKTQGLNLSAYSVGHIYAYLCLIIVTCFMYVLSIRYKDKPLSFPVTLGTIAFIGALLLKILVPSLFNLLISAFFDFFWQFAVTNTVQEAMGWTSAGAWGAFNYGLYLMIAGAAVMLYQNIKDEHPYQIFVLIWSGIMLISTQQHVRYEYYLAVNIALLSAVLISYAINSGLTDFKLFINKLTSDESKTEEHSRKKKSGKKQVEYKNKVIFKSPPPNYLVVLIVSGIVLVGVLFAITSALTNYSVGSAGGISMNPDWKASLEWMGAHTPEPGLNYTQIYDAKTFTYPKLAYGVMSWWDYGHMITYIAKRIPNANPFQQGVVEDAGASHFFVSTNETEANAVLDNAKTRYVITDIEMDVGKFYAMSTWHNSTVNVTPYQKYMLVQSGIDSYTAVALNTNEYYNTMVSRLHNFDGSYIEPAESLYIEYVDANVAQMDLPVVIKTQNTSYLNVRSAVANYNMNARTGYHAIAASPMITYPVDIVPALQHYRLVYESPTNVFANQNMPFDVKYVKIFEYVKGARIKGEGIIEINVTTNTGRQFIYRQQSNNGEFIVPYSTYGVNTYDVKSTSKYHIMGSDKTFDVSEDAVVNGLVIG